MNSQHKVSRRIRMRAFSLIELLVVFAIISILASLLISTTSRSRDRAQNITCLNTLQQVYLAVKMYADDHSGLLPSTTKTISGWDQIACPSASRRIGSTANGGYSWSPLLFGAPTQLESMNASYNLVGDRLPWHDRGRLWEPPPIASWTGKHNKLYADGNIRPTRLTSTP